MASLAPAEKAPTGKPLKVGSPHDPAEREADRIAAILTAPEEPAMPECTACAAGGAPCAACATGTRNLRRSALGPAPVESTPAVARILAQPGSALPPGPRRRFEQRLGVDLSHLRLHIGPDAARASASVNARAFAIGPDIAWGHGTPAPSSDTGERILAHEVAHVACGHAGLHRYDPPDMPPMQPSAGVTVLFGTTEDPLAAYGWLRDSLGLEGWGALSDAARLRAARQARGAGGAAPGAEESQLALGARDVLRVPMTTLLSPRPYMNPWSFRSTLFESLRIGPIAFGSGATAVTEEIARRWASQHEDIVRGEVEVRLVDPQGVLGTPAELLFVVAGQPVTSANGRLWIADVDDAVTPGSLRGVVEAVSLDAGEVAEAAVLAEDLGRLLAVVRTTRTGSHEDVSANAAESLHTMLDEFAGRVRAFVSSHEAAGQLLGTSYAALTTAAADYQGWLVEHRRAIAAATPDRNIWEREMDQTAELMRMQREAPWWAQGYLAESVNASALAHGVPDLLSGGAVSADVELRRAFRRGDVSIRGLREGEDAIRERGLIVGAVNGIVMIGTLGLGAAISPVTLGGQIAFGAISSSVGTGIVLTTQTVLTHQTTLADPVAQQIWRQGAMSAGDIALASLGAGILGGATAGFFGWLARGPNAALARQLVAESVQNPGLVRQLQPGVTARAVGPGVVEVTQQGQAGVLRFTVEGWEARLGQQVISESWVAPVGAAGGPATGGLRGLAAFQQPGTLPFGVAVGDEGWMLMGPGRSTLATGGWGSPAGGGVAAGAVPPPPGTSLAIAGGPLAGRTPGPLFVDIQGGPALRPDTGQPTFLPSLVGATPGASGFLLEPGDYRLGYGGITTTNPRDLAFARMLAQNLPDWPATPPGSIAPAPAPWVFDPRLAFPTQGPVQVLRSPGAPGMTPVPQAFFPPIGGDVVPGTPRLVPIALGNLKAQEDVTRLQPSTHGELHGRVDRAYWRRPFALAAADPEATAAMGREVGRWLRPGGFLELRLLRGGDDAKARAIAAQIPDARVVSVPRGAIAAYARTGQRPNGLGNEQWAVLQEAGPDIRGELGALGEGQFARIVRIYRGGTGRYRVLMVGAERADEFDWAAGLQASGQEVTVVNPATSPAGRQFRRGGGHLITGNIERLPPAPAYNVIREDFPFPLGRMFQPTRAFAEERIRRLLPGGRWVVATESDEFATTLQAAAGPEVAVSRTTAPLEHEATPTSPWLPETSRERFVLVFTRRRP